MNSSTRVFVVVLSIVTNLAAQTTVDDFSTSSNWSNSVALEGTAQLSISDGRANFLVSGGADNAAFIRWTSRTFSYTSDWEGQVDVRAPAAVNLTDYFYGELTAYRTGDVFGEFTVDDAPNFFSASAQLIRPGGERSGFQMGYTLLGDSDYELPTHGDGISSNTLAGSLRIAFDSSAKTIATYYDADGATSGYAWNLISSISIGAGASQDWSMSDGDTFTLALSVFSGNTPFTAGDVYFDNFSVSAIPEPSTYALLAGGLGLGLAAWRRGRGSKERSNPVALEGRIRG